MVSPLKTWQHDEPKRLWIALGGLSVLAHIGVLGLSLPYVLTIMQPSGDRTPLSVVPIELVADPVDQSSAERAAELAESQAAESRAAKAASKAEAKRAAGSAASPPPSPESDLSKPPKPPPKMSTYTRSQTSGQTNDQTRPQAIANKSLSPNSPASDSTGQNSPASASSPTSPSDPASDLSGSANENSSTSDPSGSATDHSPAMTFPNPEASSGDNSTGSVDSGGNETPVVNGTGPLPAPGTANSGTSSEQVAYLSISGSSEVPKDLQRDVVTSPPKLVSNAADVAAIVWRPQDLNCGRVDFSQPTGTYKIAVNADGTMNRATPWTEGVERATSESERAIACLIESADLTFEPAQLDGQPVFNDNLLLTVKIIEAQKN